MLHYLRIAVTAMSLSACVLLIALWVRSYSWSEIVRCPLGSARLLIVQSHQGRLEAYAGGAPFTYPTRWFAMSTYMGGMGYDTRPFWSYEASRYGRRIRGPHWFLALIVATLAPTPWIKWRFSLRTLLIAITLVAVGLGIIVVSK